MIAPHRAYHRVRCHRGRRGFAAFVTGLNAAVLLGLTLFATPVLGLPQPVANWFVILAGGAGIAHIAAAVGLIGGRAWSGSLVGYLAAAGIAVAGLRKVRRPAMLQPAARRSGSPRPLPTPRIVHPTPGAAFSRRPAGSSSIPSRRRRPDGQPVHRRPACGGAAALRGVGLRHPAYPRHDIRPVTQRRSRAHDG